jgi:putative acetyltransferase
MQFTIRQLQKSDNFALAIMIRQVFIEHDAPQQGTVFSDPTTDDIFTLFETQKSMMWVVELDNEPLACCGIFPTNALPKDCVELVKFYAAPSIRGKGIGLALLEKCIETAIQFGYKSMYIESLPQFAKAVSMYKKAGFKQLNQALGNSGHDACDLWFLKEI